VLFESQGTNAYIRLIESSVWQPLEQQFTSTLSEIDDAVSRLDQLSRIAQRSNSGEVPTIDQLQSLRLSTQSPLEEKASLPCFIFPTSRTTRFFNRTDVSLQMDTFFGYGTLKPQSSFRSLALYGLGGAGKSSVAMKYAETRRRRGDIDAMFWISSEKEVSMRQSFTDIALRLKLPDAQPKDHDENRTLVLSWLRTTSRLFD
jgi:hypothetical protein